MRRRANSCCTYLDKNMLLNLCNITNESYCKCFSNDSSIIRGRRTVPGTVQQPVLRALPEPLQELGRWRQRTLRQFPRRAASATPQDSVSCFQINASCKCLTEKIAEKYVSVCSCYEPVTKHPNGPW